MSGPTIAQIEARQEDSGKRRKELKAVAEKVTRSLALMDVVWPRDDTENGPEHAQQTAGHIFELHGLAGFIATEAKHYGLDFAPLRDLLRELRPELAPPARRLLCKLSTRIDATLRPYVTVGQTDEVRPQREHDRQYPPEWKRELLRKIDALAWQSGALAVFREHIRTVAKALADAPKDNQGSNWQDLFGPERELKLSEKFYLLAVFHDVFAEAERMSPIMEWGMDEAKPWQQPEWGYCNRYNSDGSQCVELPKEELQPRKLWEYFKKVKAAVATATDKAKTAINELGRELGEFE